MPNDDRFVLPFASVGSGDVAFVGGKGANLGEMTQAGMPVPPGFCVHTDAYRLFLEGVAELESVLAEVDAVAVDDVSAARAAGANARAALHAAPIPEGVAAAVVAALPSVGGGPLAIRSSATTEDLADASFAGQQDTYLNIRGDDETLDAVRWCWASLFTDRAILYRARAGFASHDAALSVVVQAMVTPDVSGILFTADPVSGRRDVCTIDASYGLGEALVSGLVNADLFRVDKSSRAFVERRLGDKAIALVPSPSGGTQQVTTSMEDRSRPSLTDAQVANLVEQALVIERHYGAPQDIEWCIAGDELFVVQSRPITSLFPIPVPLAPGAKAERDGLRVYLSFGHVQVMTDPISRIGAYGMSLVLPIAKPAVDQPSESLRTAAGRIFADMTPALLHPIGRLALPRVLDAIDRRLADMLRVAVDKPEFRRHDARNSAKVLRFARHFLFPVMRGVRRNIFRSDPSSARAEFCARMERGIEAQRARLAAVPAGKQRLALVRTVLGNVFELLIPVFPPAVIAGGASWRILAGAYIEVRNAQEISIVTRGLEGNSTTQMDLELGDLADMVRETPALAKHIESAAASDDVREQLERGRTVEGAARFFAGWDTFLAAYGHRGISEIDLAQPRWRENPSSLVQSLVGILHSPIPGQHREHHDKGRREAEEMGEELQRRARRGIFGGLRARVVGRLVRMMRAYLALREHGKHYAMQLFDAARTTVLECADILVERGALAHRDDVWWLEMAEVEGLLDGQTLPAGLLEERRAQRAAFAKMRPPRVICSDGDIPRPPLPELPPGTLAGLGASTGVIEGVARVVLDPTTEVLKHGDILVAPFTDPGWTPLFIHAAGLVMEVGGLMTHGSVVAREYGIPAVVGVDGCIERIKTGDRIRVDGDLGRVTLLDGVAGTKTASDATGSTAQGAI